MHIFRWLMTHPIVTAWILAALAIVLNLNMGTKGDNDKMGHDEKVTHEVVESKSHAKVEVQTDATNEVGKSPQAEKSLEAGQHVTGDSSNAAGVDGSSENTTVSTLESSEKADDAQSSSTGQAIAAAAVASVPAVAKLSKADAPNDDKQEAGAESEKGEQVNVEGLSSIKTEQLIQLAREAFWQGDKEKSVAIYHALIEREPASLSHKGELANVYWHQEKQKESAALYAEIAVPMVKEGKTKEVANMLGFIGVFFPEKAEELQGLISQ